MHVHVPCLEINEVGKRSQKSRKLWPNESEIKQENTLVIPEVPQGNVS
jgi:hypothetical protein